MIRMKSWLIAVGMTAILTACTTYSAIETGKRIDVGDGMSAVVHGSWSAINGSAVPLGGADAIWTVDGINLNKMVFFSAVDDGDPLDKSGSEEEQERRASFRSSMTETGVMELVESTFSQHPTITRAVGGKLRPRTILGHQGFEFQIEIVTAEQLEVTALAAGAIVNGKLYMVYFMAPALHFFDKERARVEAILDSLQLQSSEA